MKSSKMRKAGRGLNRAFTLVELLVVIAIIIIVVSLTIPVLQSVNRWQFINTARAELNQIQAALENYKAQYGAYPTCASTTLYNELSATAGINSGSTTNTEDTTAAKNFLVNVGSYQIAGGNLVTSVGGPDAGYTPNPFVYKYPGTNNPSGYDLWVKLYINGQTNLICNWSRQVLINSPLP